MVRFTLFIAFVFGLLAHASAQCPTCGKGVATTIVQAPVASYGSTGSTQSYGSSGSQQSYGSSGSSYSQASNSSGYYGAMRSVQQSSLASHLQNEHGINTRGMALSQMEAIHNRLHAAESRPRFSLFGWRR